MADPDIHAPLRQDVRLLGDLLGDTLQEQESETVLELVEQIRSQAKHTRAGHEDQVQQLFDTLSSLKTDQLVPIARAFSHFLNLANLAEQYHRVRRRRAYQTAEEEAQDATLEELWPRLQKAGISEDQLMASLDELSIELVLTAHPTEVTRRTLIQKYDDISHCLDILDTRRLTPQEYGQVIKRLKRNIVGAWNSDEIRADRPTPVDEAKWGFVTIEQTLWHALPAYLQELDNWLRNHLDRSLPIDFAPIRFASWMGGDRDGNPNVTWEVTEEVLLLARWMAADLFGRDIEKLQHEFSMQHCSDELRQVVGDVREPYRALLKPLRDRLHATKEWLNNCLQGKHEPNRDVITETSELLEPLLLCHRSLVECNMREIADGELLNGIRRLNCFGVTLLRLDIRQESGRHRDAIAAITRYLDLGDYNTWNEKERQDFLINELGNKRPLISNGFSADEEVNEVLNTFHMLARQSPDALGAYVISMAAAPSDVLAVQLLQKIAGMKQMMRVVPLFETIDDLQHAPDTLTRLLDIPIYRKQIQNQQEIMIGYSDSAKDGGFLAAAWMQYQAQEQLAQICNAQNVRLTLFHGRGGSTSRGGAPAHKAILSQPPGVVNGSIRITEQGEVIRAKFSPFGVAVRSLERYVAAMVEATLLPRKQPKQEWRELMDQLTTDSSSAYRDLVRNDPRFLDYFHNVTPEQELQRLPLGSRPAKRRKQGGIETLRAIPWVFAWTQMRLMLPAWLGVETAFSNALQRGEGQELHAMYERWPFFRMMIGMLEMVLAKSEPQVAAFYERRLGTEGDRQLGKELRSRHRDMIDLVKTITDHSVLLQNDAVIRRSISVRNPYLDPLHVLQVELMRSSRKQAEEIPEQTRALMITVAGLAAGMRNTG